MGIGIIILSTGTQYGIAMAKYETIRNDLGIALRNELRTNTSFLTIIGLTTANAKDHIFYKRPLDNREAYPNPHLVIEPITSPGLGFIGDNPDGQINGNIQFNLLCWVDEKPMTLSSQVEDMLVFLFNSYQVAMDKGICFVDLENTSQINDPEKEGTTQITGTFIAEINGGTQ